MSVPSPIVRSNPSPRWSVSNSLGLLPVLTPGESECSAWVKVAPPLSCISPSLGSIGALLVPTISPFSALVKPLALPMSGFSPPIRLLPPLIKSSPNTSLLLALPATILLVTVTSPDWLEIPPTSLPLTVLLVTTRVPSAFSIPPAPLPPVLLLLTVLYY